MMKTPHQHAFVFRQLCQGQAKGYISFQIKPFFSVLFQIVCAYLAYVFRACILQVNCNQFPLPVPENHLLGA